MRSRAMLGVMVVLLVAVGCSKKDDTTTAGATTTAPPTTTAPAAGTSAAPTTAKAGTTVALRPDEVVIADYQFEPENRTVKVGDTIVWTNTDDFAHYVKSDEGSELDSDPMEKDAVYSHPFTKPGTYAYHCEIHNIMKGTITVS